MKGADNEDKLLRFQETNLQNLLQHAYRHVPYYHRLLREIKMVNNGFVDLSRFTEIPILTKELIRKHHQELISKDYTTRKWYYNSSGGSTGEPIRFIQDDSYRKWGNATFYYYYNNILGIDELNARKIILWGSERDLFQGGMGWIDKIVNRSNNTLFLNSFRMTEEDKKKYIECINAYKPELIRGYAGSLYELCKYAERNKLIIYAPKTLISSAETLSYEMRKKIEKIFGIPVHDYYGSRETNNLAGECDKGLMHILEFHNHIEIINDQNLPAKEGEEGRVIVTNLHNYSMPFIRYEIGDLAELGPKKCKCGNMLPTLKKITGRITDHFIKEDGTIIHGEYFTHLFYLKDWVRRFQVIQEDYNKIKILIILKTEPNELEIRDIEKKIKLIMGQCCAINMEFVEEIPLTKNGKYLYTKSLVRWRI